MFAFSHFCKIYCVKKNLHFAENVFAICMTFIIEFSKNIFCLKCSPKSTFRRYLIFI